VLIFDFILIFQVQRSSVHGATGRRGPGARRRAVAAADISGDGGESAPALLQGGFLQRHRAAATGQVGAAFQVRDAHLPAQAGAAQRHVCGAAAHGGGVGHHLLRWQREHRAAPGGPSCLAK